MKCPRCQQENLPQAKFCLECAMPLACNCPNCGTPLPPAAKFCMECARPVGAPATTRSRFASPETYTPKHLAERILTSRAALEGERKLVTVLFADLKGSMELLADRDPEEARQILDPVLERMMEAVHRYEGTVNQVLGDGIMALFGAPLSHEDHGVRACYAALRMQEAVKQYAEELRRREGVLLQIRVGLNSGEVVVRSIGSDLRMDYTAVGQTTHLAARMEQMAAAGSSLITADTLRLVEGYVEVKGLGRVAVKGLPDAVEVYELTGAGLARTRLQAAALRGLTRFVGRDVEVEHLRRGLERAEASHGQVVAIVGEAGVGKSRLVYEFTHSHRVQGWLVLEAASVSYGKATSYLPVIDLLKSYFKIGDQDDHREMRDKVLGRVLGLDRALEALLPPLLALLDVPVEDAAWKALDPPQRRQHTLDAERLLLRETQVQPLLLVFEDLHWIDEETQALLDDIVERLGSARLLLLVNYRPEYQHRWGSKTAYSQLRLDTLPVESTAELLQALLGPDPGLASLSQMLLKRGNPFFLEETVRTLVETAALEGERGAYRLTRSMEALQVPATVQTILAARIDRLPAEEKQLLQAASVIGKDAPFAILAAISEQSEEVVRRGLAHLLEAEFLYETRLFPDLEYTFKHALTHEVTYGSLLGDRRRQLHARIVEAMELLYADRLEEQVERLGQHARRGHLWNKAVKYLHRAGVKAYDRSANREAMTLLEQAMDALGHLPGDLQTLELAVDLRLSLYSSLSLLGDVTRSRQVLIQAERAATELGDPRRLSRVFTSLAAGALLGGEYVVVVDHGRRALEEARRAGDVGAAVAATAYLGFSHLLLGRFAPAVEYASETLSLIGDRIRERYGMRGFPAVFAHSWLAGAWACQGRFAAAERSAREAQRLAADIGHAYSQVVAHYWAGRAPLIQGRGQEAIRAEGYALALARETGSRHMIGWAAGCLGAAQIQTGRLVEGISSLEQAVQVLAPDIKTHLPFFLASLADGYLRAGRREETTDPARQALDLARAQGDRLGEALALHLLGDIAAGGIPPDTQAAEGWYRAALDLTTETGLPPLVAHSHLGLGKLYLRRGRRDRAHEHLATATAMYRDMDMSFWMEQAEAEMKELA